MGSATALDGVLQMETASSFPTTCNGFRFPCTQEKIARPSSLDTLLITWFVLEALALLLAMVILVAPLSAPMLAELENSPELSPLVIQDAQMLAFMPRFPHLQIG